MRSPARPLILCALFASLAIVPAAVNAQIYTYETPDGEVLITSEEHPEYRLIEKIDTERPASASRASTRTSAASSRSTQSTHRATMGTSTLPFAARESHFDDIIQEASEAYDVPFGFIKAVVRVESAFQPDAVSHAGAMGLMQLMPRTAESLDVTDAFDPRQNIFGGARFLRILTDRYDGDINLILAAYNAGDVAVRRYDGIPYPKVRQYVASVYYWYQAYSADVNSP